MKQQDQSSSPSSAAAVAVAVVEQNSPIERLLASINDALDKKIRTDAELRHQADKNQQMMNEWMIAAAVIDRFCFIVFTITLIIVTILLYIRFLFHP